MRHLGHFVDQATLVSSPPRSHPSRSQQFALPDPVARSLCHYDLLVALLLEYNNELTYRNSGAGRIENAYRYRHSLHRNCYTELSQIRVRF